MPLFGRYIFTLRAMQDGQLRPTPGKQLHGALFSLLHDEDASFADALHDEPDKPFAMTPFFQGEHVPEWRHQKKQVVRTGDMFLWQVSGLTACMLQHLQSLPTGSEFVLNDIRWRLEACFTRHDEHPLAGRMDEKDLLRHKASAKTPRHIMLEFLTPTLFHRNHHTYAWPAPATLFASLAIRWNRLGLQPAMDDKEILKLSDDIIPCHWTGCTAAIDFDKKQRFEGFVGSFQYNLVLLPEDVRRKFLCLARFAEFAGIGRMTTHGLGVVRVKSD